MQEKANEPKINGVTKHPLLLIAKSGQKKLVMHRTTLELLKLKWRYLPKLAYYINTFLYLTFFILFITYATENTNKIEHGKRLTNNTFNTSFEIIKRFDESKTHYGFTLMLSLYFLIYEIGQMIIEKFIPYFMSVKNVLELFTYILTSIILILYKLGKYYKSIFLISIFFAFVDLVLRFEKMKFIGVYVIALRRSFGNLFKLFPLFISLYKLKYDLGRIKDDNDSSIFSLSSVYNAFDESNLLISILLVNFLIGVAFVKLKKVMDNAEMYFIQNRIQYVLNIQYLLIKFSRYSKYLNKLKYVLLFRYIDSTEDMISKVIRYLTNIRRSFREYFRTGFEYIDGKDKKVEEIVDDLKKSSKVEINGLKDYISNLNRENESRMNE